MSAHCLHPSRLLDAPPAMQLLVKDAHRRLPLLEVQNDPWIKANADPDMLARGN